MPTLVTGGVLFVIDGGRRFASDRLEIEEKSFEAIRTTAGPDLESLILAAASGNVPRGKDAGNKIYRTRAQNGFTSVGGGIELAGKAFSLGAWPVLKPEIMPFCNAVRKFVGLPETEDIDQ